MSGVTRSPRVYVVQRAAYKNRNTGQWVDKYDLSSAEEFGTLVYLLPPGNVPPELEETIARMDHRLNDYWPSQDHILAVGDPVAIALAVLRAAHWGVGSVSLLKWDRIDQRYYPYVLPG